MGDISVDPERLQTEYVTEMMKLADSYDDFSGEITGFLGVREMAFVTKDADSQSLELYEAFDRACVDYSRILAETAANIRAAGTALSEAADEHKITEGEIEEEFMSALDELE